MKQTLKTNPQESFRWIVGILKELNIPFQVSGGLAARVYGSERPLNDIDLDIADDCFNDLAEKVREFIVFGPKQFKDERWDLMLMTLNHHGQEIDISGAKGQICDFRTGKWVDATADLSRGVEQEVFGVRVPVMPAEEVIEYKAMLKGEHQQQDIEAIRNKLNQE